MDLKEITKSYNDLVCSAIEMEYKTSAYNQETLELLANKLNKQIEDYLNELKQEHEKSP